MIEGLEMRLMPLSLATEKAKVHALLSQCGLRYDDRLTSYLGVFDADDRLVAGGGLADASIRCLAVSPQAEGEGLAARIVGRLLSEAAQCGWHNVRLFTKPEHLRLFTSMGFALIGQADGAIVLESQPQAHVAFEQELRRLPRCGRVGAVVMHANPFTRGHLFLCEHAAAQVDTLFVVVVASDASQFTTAERLDMARRALAHLPHVQVVEGGRYAISADVFPTYFLKDLSRATAEQVSLDLDVFCRIVAPSLGVAVRYVGSEPTDALTAYYNEAMRQMLPGRGIEVVEVPRTGSPRPVSASAVRQALADGHTGEALAQVPLTTVPFVLAHAATQALRQELATTPKPGLVDDSDAGAHDDMDKTTMQASIRALQPWFARAGEAAIGPSLPGGDLLRTIGLQAEQAMLAATGGINTHRGALYALGLMTAAVARAWASDGSLHWDVVRRHVSTMAASMEPAAGTHGSDVVSRYGVRGARAEALTGYERLFDKWLPWLQTSASPLRLHRLLLQIVLDIDDTTLYHRGGTAAAAFARAAAEQALMLADDALPAALEKLNTDFTRMHISPGGAADMLALTIFVASLQ